MDNRRLFLFAALVMVAFLIYQAWMQDYGPKPSAQPPAANTTAAPVPEIPLAPNAPASTANRASSSAEAAPNPSVTKLPAGEQIHVRTDVLDVVIDTAGGDIRQAELLGYPVELKKPQLVKVLNSDNAELLIAQSGLQTHSGPTAPTHEALYTVSQNQYQLAPDQKFLNVTLSWKDQQGLEVLKTYTFTRGSYQIGLSYSLQNGTAEPWSGAQYLQFENKYTEESHSLFSVQRYDYQRVALYDSNGYHQDEFKDLSEKRRRRDAEREAGLPL